MDVVSDYCLQLILRYLQSCRCQELSIRRVKINNCSYKLQVLSSKLSLFEGAAIVLGLLRVGMVDTAVVIVTARVIVIVVILY